MYVHFTKYQHLKCVSVTVNLSHTNGPVCKIALFSIKSSTFCLAYFCLVDPDMLILSERTKITR